jgi:hypothetical protein
MNIIVDVIISNMFYVQIGFDFFVSLLLPPLLPLSFLIVFFFLSLFRLIFLVYLLSLHFFIFLSFILIKH